MKAFKPRVQVQSAGHFASAPLAFPKVEEAVRHALKFEFTAGGTGTPSQPSGEPSTDRLLIDFGELDAAAFDPKRVIRDCELVRDIAARHPEALSASWSCSARTPSATAPSSRRPTTN